MSLAEQIREALRLAAAPDKAPAMQAYMKSAMPYRGVTVPLVRATVRTFAVTGLEELQPTALDLWDNAEFREERYAAAVLTGLPIARGRLDLLPLHEHMIVTGAWWDHVDEAAHRIAELRLAHPEAMAEVLARWSADVDLWRRRVSIIGQLGAREQTDTHLLTLAVENNAGDKEFFIRKAIGWALRDFARTDAEWVRAFVAARPGLSGLSRREALKHL